MSGCEVFREWVIYGTEIGRLSRAWKWRGIGDGSSCYEKTEGTRLEICRSRERLGFAQNGWFVDGEKTWDGFASGILTDSMLVQVKLVLWLTDFMVLTDPKQIPGFGNSRFQVLVTAGVKGYKKLFRVTTRSLGGVIQESWEDCFFEIFVLWAAFWAVLQDRFGQQLGMVFIDTRLKKMDSTTLKKMD
ncbi:unnamed protein product [Vicia faba]|uniref:Uncharacterized protein n=1 Tax=Vicia faba TaxID=3906 RepID=A0AAV0ZH94_VICFA|nr:unnamed protein product [Vicia faba]